MATNHEEEGLLEHVVLGEKAVNNVTRSLRDLGLITYMAAIKGLGTVVAQKQQTNGNSIPEQRNKTPLSGKGSGSGSWWNKLTPKQRQKEMQRRVRLGARRARAKAKANGQPTTGVDPEPILPPSFHGTIAD